MTVEGKRLGEDHSIGNARHPKIQNQGKGLLQVSEDKRIMVTGEVRAEGRSFLTKD